MLGKLDNQGGLRVFISTATSTDEAARAATVAVLPVGSFEQHGDHLPLATDSLIAGIIAKRIADDYNLFLLPPITIGCSHEHAGFVGSVSISSTTQEANVSGPRMVLFPHSKDWQDARTAAGCETNNHDDMHGGEAETSILLAEAPDLVRDSYRDADHLADDRRLLLTTGLAGYTSNGIIGLPSKATAEKGHALLASFSRIFKEHLSQLQ